MFYEGQKVIVKHGLSRRNPLPSGKLGIYVSHEMRDMAGQILTVQILFDQEFKAIENIWTWDASCVDPLPTDSDSLFELFIQGRINENTYIKLKR